MHQRSHHTRRPQAPTLMCLPMSRLRHGFHSHPLVKATSRGRRSRPTARTALTAVRHIPSTPSDTAGAATSRSRLAGQVVNPGGHTPRRHQGELAQTSPGGHRHMSGRRAPRSAGGRSARSATVGTGRKRFAAVHHAWARSRPARLIILGAVAGIVWRERNLSFRAALKKLRGTGARRTPRDADRLTTAMRPVRPPRPTLCTHPRTTPGIGFPAAMPPLITMP
jgi:hypothetical protein